MGSITVETGINASLHKTWKAFTQPDAIKQWNAASDDWHTTHAENDLRPGGRFTYRMEAKDGSEGFDLTGIYDEVSENERIAFTLADGRKVTVLFEQVNNVSTRVVETFEPEGEHSADFQWAGWQAILDRFKRYVEAL